MVISTKYIPDVRNIREIVLPRIPEFIINSLSTDYNAYQAKWTETDDGKGIYVLSDSFNEELNEWCRANICDSILWEFQIITGDTYIHKDSDPHSLGEDPSLGLARVKFVYNIQTGGDNVRTEFFEDGTGIEMTDSYLLEAHKWYIFRTESWHRVVGIEPKKTRFAVVGHIF